MEQALLIEADAVLTTAVRRAVVPRASNLEMVSTHAWRGLRVSFTPFSFDSICRLWLFVVSVPRQEQGHIAGGGSMDADMVAEGDSHLAVSVEEVGPDQVWVDMHIPGSEHPLEVS